MTVGGTAQNVSPGPAEGAFHLGGRADLLLGRARGSDMAVGSYVDAASAGFRDFDVGGGAEWLLPWRDELPLVLSGGGFVRNGGGRAWSPGIAGAVFFGSRSYNFHSWYGLAAGLFVQTRWVPGPPSTVDVIFGVQLDAELLAMPVLLLWGLFR